MLKHFLFLEFRDSEINTLLLTMIEICSNEKPSTPPHLTVRGPNDAPIPEKTIESCRLQLKYDVLKISNVGRFSNKDEEVVYFHVDSPHLRDIWYKPTFTIGEYGFNPHLSIYRGKDKIWAEVLTNFLEHEKIELLCAEFELVHYVSKQLPLIKPEIKIANQLSRLISSGRISDSLVVRLNKLANEYNSQKKDGSIPFQRFLI